MARQSWEAARLRAQTASFDYFKELLQIRSGSAFIEEIYGVLDTGIDELEAGKAMNAEGTFPVFAKLSVWRADLGWLPVKNEEFRIRRTAYPNDERLYLVETVDDSSDLLTIELQAQAYNGRPFQI